MAILVGVRVQAVQVKVQPEAPVLRYYRSPLGALLAVRAQVEVEGEEAQSEAHVADDTALFSPPGVL